MSENLSRNPESNKSDGRLSPLAETEIYANEAYDRLDATVKRWMAMDPDVTADELETAWMEFKRAVTNRNMEEDSPGSAPDETAGPE